MKNHYLSVLSLAVLISCGQDTQRDDEKIIHAWVSTPDQSKLLSHDTLYSHEPHGDSTLVIHIDTTQKFQEIEGFGYTLTGGSAYLINRMDDTEKNALLLELFGNEDQALRMSYLRISLGASDLNHSVFSYDDLPQGHTDTSLTRFNPGPDTVDVIPLLKSILKINPRLKIMASPWSAPAWMKTNGSSIGGSLRPEYYHVYANYFVKYIRQMQEFGITIDAITPQNEPHHGGNNPSMLMSAVEQALFIKGYLGLAFKQAEIQTKIIIWDHNCDMPEFPITILNDPEAKQFIHGSAFHLYAGEVSALSKVHAAHPDKGLYFTEQWTGSRGTFDGDFQWHIKHVIIGTMRNWSRTALEWNLASDPEFSIHTPGGCTECKGALTIDGNSIARNVGYYIIGHASRFVPPGSVRVASNEPDNLPNVAFVTPEGQMVLIVLNDDEDETVFEVDLNGRRFRGSLQSGAVGTYVW